MKDQTAQQRPRWPHSVPPRPARRPGRPTRGHRRVAVLLILALAGALAACNPGSRSANATAAAPVVDQAALKKAWACGLSFGLDKLKALGPDGKNLLDAINVTLTGRDLAANRADLLKASIEFGIDIGPPWLECFEPYFFPDHTGGGASPVAPIGLTVRPDTNNGTVMLLTWNSSSENVLYFVVSNGTEERNAPVQPGTGIISYTWTGLQPGSRACFRVRASNGDVSSNWDPNSAPWYTCATTSSPQPTPPDTATPTPANQCVFLLPNQVDCASSDPQVSLEGENVGDTSGCTFSSQIGWGDGSQQTVQYQGADGMPSFVANHTYQHQGTFSITLSPSVVSGTCSAFNGSYTFTYG
jgi:hypothetical protein